MTDQAREIAGRLTKAQREAVCYRDCYGPSFGTIYATRPTMAVLSRLGLLCEQEGGWAYLNETGLAVRRALLEGKTDGQ